jgi:L-fuconolactonase
MDIVDSQVHIWGADTPDRPTYYECITLFTEHLPWLKGEDLEWVMGRGVREWLGWR